MMKARYPISRPLMDGDCFFYVVSVNDLRSLNPLYASVRGGG